HGDYFKILSRVELDCFERPGESVEDLAAEHGTAVVDQGQNYGLLRREKRGQGNRAASFVLKNEIHRELRIEALIDADAFESARQRRLEVAVLHAVGLLHRRGLAGLRLRSQRSKQDRRNGIPQHTTCPPPA